MVEYLEIRGKKYPVRIGYYVMKKVKEETGKSLGDAMQEAEDNPALHEIILYAALKVGAFVEKQELDLKEEDMPFILDMVFYDYLKLFKSEKFFPKEVADKVKKEMNQALGNPKKKKRTKEPSK